MRILVSLLRARGGSLITTLPAEVVRRLGIGPDQELEWIEDGIGGFRVMPRTLESAESLEAHARVIAEYDSVFRALAK